MPPGEGENERDLSVSYNKVGDVQVAQGDLPSGAEILSRQPRHRRAPGEIRSRQRRLAARSVGVLRQGRRRAGGAGRSHRGAEILSRRPRHRERLAKSDPGNAGWQRDLSVSYDKVGDVQVAQGDLPAALKSYRDSLAIASGWRSPIPATPAGSAICRCPTTRSATCRWRRAISPRR